MIHDDLAIEHGDSLRIKLGGEFFEEIRKPGSKADRPRFCNIYAACVSEFCRELWMLWSQVKRHHDSFGWLLQVFIDRGTHKMNGL